jgi:hypothetical protein
MYYLQLRQLRAKLPVEAVVLITGLTEVDLSWERLNERYGNRQVAVVTAISRLINNEVPRGPGYAQVEAIEAAIQRAINTLASVQREGELFSDLSVLSSLLGKLPSTVKDRWFQERGAGGKPESQAEEGSIFLKFMKRERSAVVAAQVSAMTDMGRKTSLSEKLSEPSKQAPTTTAYANAMVTPNLAASPAVQGAPPAMAAGPKGAKQP